MTDEKMKEILKENMALREVWGAEIDFIDSLPSSTKRTEEHVIQYRTNTNLYLNSLRQDNDYKARLAKSENKEIKL